MRRLFYYERRTTLGFHGQVSQQFIEEGLTAETHRRVCARYSRGHVRTTTRATKCRMFVETARLYAWLVGLFAAIGLVVAMTGIYGVIAYLVSLRTREFGIRMALGADSGQVLRLMIRHGLWLTIAGLAIGLALAVVIMQVLCGLLFGVAATDPITFAGTAALGALTALAAYLLPAPGGEGRPLDRPARSVATAATSGRTSRCDPPRRRFALFPPPGERS